MRRLILTDPLLRAALRALREAPAAALALSVGVCRLAPDREDLLARSFRPIPWPPPADLRPEEAVLLRWGATALPGPETRGRALWILEGNPVGPPRLHGLDGLAVIGPGMPLWPDPPAPEPSARWVRTRGALGEAAWRRLAAARYGIIGCGRTGSLLAEALAAAGARSLVLVDPDRLEPGNLGEMVALPEEAIGRPKGEVLAEALRARFPWVEPEPVTTSVAARPALRLLRTCDLLISAVDRDAARLAVGILGALYLKPVLDVGSGIGLPGAPQWIGAEARLILPGDGCLECWGGVAESRRAGEALARAVEADLLPPPRAGSLRSLNMAIVGLALRLWEDLLTGMLRRSAWIRVTWANGIPDLRSMLPPPRPDCPLCAQRGMGDAGLAALPPLLQALAGARGVE
jgi:Dinucleotide-utilizing enzymes involved in molybdopterin and thiamine biosynthesis family 2